MKRVGWSDLNIEFAQDWSVGLGATLGDEKKIKKYYSTCKDFLGKSQQCHIVEVRKYNNPTKID